MPLLPTSVALFGLAVSRCLLIGYWGIFALTVRNLPIRASIAFSVSDPGFNFLRFERGAEALLSSLRDASLSCCKMLRDEKVRL